MPVQIGQTPESDFSNPLGLLSDCHRRIERFLDVLVRVHAKRRGGKLQTEEKASLEKALNYFRNSAPKHTADEEESLFPRMRASGSALACLKRLEGDHEAANRDHEIVDSLGVLWLAEGKLSSEDADELGRSLNRLAILYSEHIAIEDSELFPIAARVLPESDLAAVGREMAARRARR